MASILKAQKSNAAKADTKAHGKRKAQDIEEDEGTQISAPAPKKRNKQRVLLLSSRGITHRMRHLMNDLEVLLPHVKKGIASIDSRSLHDEDINGRCSSQIQSLILKII